MIQKSVFSCVIMMPLNGKPRAADDQRAGNAGQVVDLAGNQGRSLHGPGHLHHIDVQAMLFVDSRVFSDEESEKGEAERRIADADFFQLLGAGRWGQKRRDEHDEHKKKQIHDT